MKVKFHRLVSAVCALAMCAAMLPAAVLAEDPAVAQIGETTYPTLQEAVNDAGADAVITLLADTTETVTIPVDKGVTLDLNGYTVTGSTQAVVVDGGSLTVKDSTVTAEPVVSDDYKTVTYTSGVLEAGSGKHAVQIYNGGSFVLESGTVSSSGNCGVYAGASGKGSGTITINGGYIHAREYGVGAINEGTVLTVNGGIIEADDNAAVAGNGSDGMGGTTINIAGGTMISHIISTGYIACGVYHPQDGALNITGGTIVADGGVGVLMRGGSANITGGSIIATGTGNGKVGDSTVLSGHYGVLYDTKSGYPGLQAEDKVTIGGSASITAEDPCVEVRTDEASGEKTRVVVESGSFSQDVSDFVIGGNKTVLDEESGKYVLAPDTDEAVAVYNGKGYMTLKEALDAAGNGPATVSLTNDTTESVTIPAGADITLDLAEGATLTGTSSEHAIINNGTLTVTGKGTVKAMATNKAAVENTGIVNLKGGNFTRNVVTPGSNWYVLDNNAGTMNISDTANVYAEAPNASLIRNVGTSADKKAALNISGGTITQNDFIAVKNDDYGVLNITGGTITSAEQAVQNWHEATITGGTMNGKVISWAYTGMPDMDNTLSISGSAMINGDVLSVTFDNVGLPQVTITGGTINGTLGKGSYKTGALTLLPDNDSKASLVVSGGSFKNAVPEAFCAENFHPNANADGTYSVHTHQFGPWITTVQPGHTTSGKQVQTCTICGYEIAQTVPPTGNNDHPDIEQAKKDGTWGQAESTPAPTSGTSAANGSVTSVPQTSDDMPLGLLGGMAAAAAAAMAVLVLRKRRS